MVAALPVGKRKHIEYQCNLSEAWQEHLGVFFDINPNDLEDSEGYITDYADQLYRAARAGTTKMVKHILCERSSNKRG